jgi:hypothetical protein
MTEPSSLAGLRLTRRIFAFAGALALMMATAACFDKEPAQRKAFITFLQTRIIDKPGLHVPIMSEQDVADLGRYADHYRVLNGFHHQLDLKVSKDLQRAASAGRPKSLEELRNQRALFPMLTSTMTALRTELDKAEADAETARKALKQPADLKFVYDKAFERMGTIPARGFRELFPLVDAMLPAIGAVAVFLDEHRDTVELRGNQVTAKDAAVRDKLAALLDNAQTMSAGAAAGQQKLRAIVTGREAAGR